MKKQWSLYNEDVSADIMWSTGKEVDDTNIRLLLESAMRRPKDRHERNGR